MANAFHRFYPSDDPAELNGPDVTAISIGDLLYWDSANGVLKPLTSLTTGASEAADQESIAATFAGVSKSARRVTDTPAGPVRVLPECVMDFPCVSFTPVFGDLVGPTWDGGSALVNQKVKKVTDKKLAIGVVVKNYAAATTTVKVAFFSPIIRSSPARDNAVVTASYYFTGTPAATDQVFFVATRRYRVKAISQVHSVAAGGTSTLQVVKDTSTNAPGAGTDLLASAFDLNGTANTVQAGSLSATAADLLLDTGDRLSVDFGHAIQSSAGVAVTVELEPI